MAGRPKPCVLLGIALVAMTSFLPAQIHGVPASVSSFGFGGNFSSAPGVPASVTSLGPLGFGHSPVVFGNCCFSGLRFGGHPSVFSNRSRGFRRGFFPTFVPYAVPYTEVVVVPQSAGYEDDEEDPGGSTIFDRSSFRRRPVRQHLVEEAAPAAPAASPAAEPEPVTAQPSTLLVFRDGRQAEVQNYAIVGDTLFNLSEDRSYRILLADLDLTATRKANADRGVDFQVPPDASH